MQDTAAQTSSIWSVKKHVVFVSGNLWINHSTKIKVNKAAQLKCPLVSLAASWKPGVPFTHQVTTSPGLLH